MTEQYRALAVAIFSMAIALPGFTGLQFEEFEDGRGIAFAFHFAVGGKTPTFHHAVTLLEWEESGLSSGMRACRVLDSIAHQLYWAVDPDDVETRRKIVEAVQ